MTYTEKQKAAIKARFNQIRLYQGALIVPLGGAALLIFNSKLFIREIGMQSFVFGIALLVVSAIGFSWFNWRCPACRKPLGGSFSPEQCPSCGVPLR